MTITLLLEPDKLEAIIPLIEKYEKRVSEAEPIFQLEGRRLEEIMRILPHHQVRYDQALQEVKAIEEWLNIIKDKRTSKLWKSYLEGYQKALSTRDIQTYIAGHDVIIEVNQVGVELTLIKNKLASIVEALKQMAWMMGNTTKLRVAELQDSII